MHDGYAGQKARILLVNIANSSGLPNLTFKNTLDYVVYDLNQTTPPKYIDFRKDGKFYKILRREWNDSE